jgi:hypothetical protein
MAIQASSTGFAVIELLIIGLLIDWIIDGID